MDITKYLPVCIIVAIILVVVLTELVKRLDKKDKLKGYRVYIPFAFSCAESFLLRLGKFFEPQQVWFWWAAIFALSVFFFEAILKKAQGFLGGNA